MVSVETMKVVSWLVGVMMVLEGEDKLVAVGPVHVLG